MDLSISVFLKTSVSDFCFMKGNDNTEHTRTQGGICKGVDHFTGLVSYIVCVNVSGCHKGLQPARICPRVMNLTMLQNPVE